MNNEQIKQLARTETIEEVRIQAQSIIENGVRFAKFCNKLDLEDVNEGRVRQLVGVVLDESLLCLKTGDILEALGPPPTGPEIRIIKEGVQPGPLKFPEDHDKPPTKSMLAMVHGKKTYGACVLLTLASVMGFVTGQVTMFELAYMILTAAAGASIRHSISSVESQKKCCCNAES